MIALEAAHYLMSLCRTDDFVKHSITLLLDREGFMDIASWADAKPDDCVAVALSMQHMQEELEDFGNRLATGDLA